MNENEKLRRLTRDPSGDFLVIFARGPKPTKEIRRMQIPMFLKKIAIPPTAEHQVGMKLTTELRAPLGNETRQIRHSIKLLTEARHLIAGQNLVTDHPFLNHQKIITPYRSNQQRGRNRRGTLTAKILDEVEKLPRLIADLSKKFKILGAVIILEIMIPTLVSGGTTVKKSQKSVIPSHAHKIDPKANPMHAFILIPAHENRASP